MLVQKKRIYIYLFFQSLKRGSALPLFQVSDCAPCLTVWSCDLVLDDRPVCPIWTVYKRIQTVTAVKHTIPFVLSSLVHFFFLYIFSSFHLFCLPSNLNLLYSQLYAAVIMHPAFILLSFFSPLISFEGYAM